MSNELRYNDEQANEIVRTAVRLAAPGEITFEEMVLAAAELGISRDELAEAEAKYRYQTSEAGQREEFRVMQRHQVKSIGFQLIVVAAILALIIFVDAPKIILVTIAIVIPVVAALFLIFRAKILDAERPAYEQAYQRWQRQKRCFLRPEETQEHVLKVLKADLTYAERLNEDEPRKRLRLRLQKRLLFDKKRALEIVDAYLLEHPEVASQRFR
jgi:hypothetical protein